MRKIILDTNFLMVPFQFKVDIFSEIERICNFNYRLCVYEQSSEELKNIIRKQRGSHKRAARMAMQLVIAKKPAIIKKQGYVDEMILEDADSETIVATLDTGLRKKLLSKGISVIILRQKKYLQLLERKIL